LVVGLGTHVKGSHGEHDKAKYEGNDDPNLVAFLASSSALVFSLLTSKAL